MSTGNQAAPVPLNKLQLTSGLGFVIVTSARLSVLSVHINSAFCPVVPSRAVGPVALAGQTPDGTRERDCRGDRDSQGQTLDVGQTGVSLLAFTHTQVQLTACDWMQRLPW